ncbi:hypothetical protein HHK36_024277 [Tetracentron sinense]|uniref:Uncharacterized protein n=1 Tax=Tetracentron sinense TaxID=13715 RepID=A0A835D440_TETSI|nr:hypothetical protein HHK36_024277 [Tetracentron sinense]
MAYTAKTFSLFMQRKEIELKTQIPNLLFSGQSLDSKPHFSSSMDSFSHKKPSSTHKEKHHQPSTTELLSSAKIVAEAAKSSLSHDTSKVDKAKVSGAAADLLAAVERYGNLEEEKGFGKYVDKAENYLHQYHSSHSSTTTTHNNSDHSTSTTHSTTDTHSSTHTLSGADDSHSEGGGYGEYFKMAEGFLKKH